MLGAWITRLQLLVLLVPHFAGHCGDYTLIISDYLITPWKFVRRASRKNYTQDPAKPGSLGLAVQKLFRWKTLHVLSPPHILRFEQI